MKNTLRQVFHSSKFLVGFIIFAVNPEINGYIVYVVVLCIRL